MIKRRWHNRALLLIFTLLGLLWSYRLGERRLWIDEFFSINIAQRPLADIWSMDSHPNKFYFNTFPPLYETVLHFFWDPSGQNLFLPRLLSLIFTGVAVFFVFKLAAMLFDRTTAVYAALLTVLNASYVLFAQMIRGYALLNALTLTSVYLFFRMVKTGDFRKRYLVGLLAVNVCILYTFYLGALVILMEMFFVIFLFRDRVNKQMNLWLAGAFVFFIPWEKHFLEDLGRESVVNGSLPFPKDLLWGMLRRFERAFDSMPLFLLYMAVFVLTSIYGWSLLKKKNEKGFWIMALALFFLIPTIFTNWLTFKVSSASETMRMRYFFIFLAPFFILAAVFIRRISTKFRGWLFALFFFGSLAALYMYFEDPIGDSGYPADIAALAQEAKAFPVPAGDKVDMEIETDLYVPLFVYYFYGPEHFREVTYPNLWSGYKSINHVSEKYKLFYNIACLDKGVLERSQVEAAGCNWDDVGKQLIKNGWATPIGASELALKKNLNSVQDRVAGVFRKDFYKIYPVFQRVQSDLVLRSVLVEKVQDGGKIFDWMVKKGYLQRSSDVEGILAHDWVVIGDDLKKEYPAQAEQVVRVLVESLHKHFLRSVFDLKNIDWLFLVYSDWNECWGKPFSEFYKDRVRSSGFSGRLHLVRKKSVGSFVLEIYKVDRH